VSRRLPDGFHSVTPRIVVEDVGALVQFLRVVFAATGELRVDSPSQLTIGDSVVMVSEAGPRPPFPAFLYVYVDDADATYKRSLDAGAISLEAVGDMPYGDRRGMVQDPFGNVWQIASHKPANPAG
jgi:PhnB protein